MSSCGCQCCSLEILTLRTRLEIANRELKEKTEIIENLTGANLDLKLELYQLQDKLKSFKAKEKEKEEKLASSKTPGAESIKEEISTSNNSVTNETAADVSTMTQMLLMQGYIYEEKSKSYYNQETGYYYLPANNLYFNVFTQQYFCFDAATNSYVAFERGQPKESQPEKQLTMAASDEVSVGNNCQNKAENFSFCLNDDSVDPSAYEVLMELCNQVEQMSVIEKPKRKRKLIAEKQEIRQDRPVMKFDDIEAYCTTYEEHMLQVAPRKKDIAAEYPPAIRVMVLDSDCLGKSILHSVITHVHPCQIGRETSDITIRSESVSRKHAKIFYDSDAKGYFIQDLGSRNGTQLNDHIIPPGPKNVAQLEHLAKVNIGLTTFELHIHEGLDTCDGCEPGLQMKPQSLANNSAQPLSFADKEALRRSELKALKKKFGLQNSSHENGPGLADNYTDRSHRRRVTKGSDNPYRKDTPAASVDSAISAENKGFKMLSKLGWKGESLGKTNSGIMEPINPVATLGRSGVGSEGVATIAESPQALQKKERWMKAQMRYERIENPQANQISERVPEPAPKPPKQWVAGGVHIG